VLEYKSGAAWQPIASGTTVGYERILKFEPVRLRITSSRLTPTLSASGLYKQANPK
jgi:alpha-L-fucosidase